MIRIDVVAVIVNLNWAHCAGNTFSHHNIEFYLLLYSPLNSVCCTQTCQFMPNSVVCLKENTNECHKESYCE
jgi:hypothetical protein